jgi:hypothetical protein
MHASHAALSEYDFQVRSCAKMKTMFDTAREASADSGNSLPVRSPRRLPRDELWQPIE